MTGRWERTVAEGVSGLKPPGRRGLGSDRRGIQRWRCAQGRQAANGRRPFGVALAPQAAANVLRCGAQVFAESFRGGCEKRDWLVTRERNMPSFACARVSAVRRAAPIGRHSRALPSGAWASAVYAWPFKAVVPSASGPETGTALHVFCVTRLRFVSCWSKGLEVSRLRLHISPSRVWQWAPLACKGDAYR